MNVLMFTQALEIGGLERMVLGLSDQLNHARGWSCQVLAFDQRAGRDEETLIPEFRRRGVPVRCFKKPPGVSVDVMRQLRAVARAGDVSIVHTHDLAALIYASLLRLTGLVRYRIVHTQHSFIHLDTHRRYRAMERIFSRLAHTLVAVSEEVKATYGALGFPSQCIHLIENAATFAAAPPLVRPDRLRERDPLIAELPVLCPFRTDRWILYLARLYPRKGQDHALSLWGRLPPEWRARSVVVFVGPESSPGERTRLDALRSAAPDPARLIFAGPSQEPQRWLRVADVYLSCSESEGTPLGPLEAVGSGLPALLSSIPGHAHLRRHSQQYPLNEPAVGADTLAAMLQSAENEAFSVFNETWNRAAALRASYAQERMAGRYRRIYERTAGGTS